MTSTTTSCTSSGDALRPPLREQIRGEECRLVTLPLPDTGDQRVGGGISQLVEPALQRRGCCFGVEPGCGDAFVTEKALQVGDVHAQRQQPGGDGMAQQVRVDAFTDPSGAGNGSHDLTDALAGQHMRRWSRTLLTAREQRPGPPRADVQPQQLRQVTPDRHLPALATLALADGDHTLDETDILDPELHQFGGPGAGLQQGLQHQASATVLGIGLIKETQLLLDRQPVDATASFRRSTQAGALARGFEDSLALRVVDILAHEDSGNGSGGAFDGGHAPVCSGASGVQTSGLVALG